MIVQDKLEDAACKIVSSSLAANGNTDWVILNSFSTGSIDGATDPKSVQVIAGEWKPLDSLKYINGGTGTTTLSIMVYGVKRGGLVSATEYKTVRDYIVNAFLQDNLAGTLMSNTTGLTISGINDLGNDPQTVLDGWMTKQDLEIMCGRTS